MPKIVTTDSFIKEAMNIHGFIYYYDKVKYINNQTKVIITCKEHGDFEQIPNSHLRGKGCIKCGGKQQLDQKQFIQKAKKMHGNIYGYSVTKYLNSRENIDIICKEHGIFSQRAINHLQGNGCKFCAIEEHERTGWKLSDWKKAAENSKNFDSFKVYIIRCWNDDEEFFKVGRTFTSVNERFNINSHLPYNWKIIKIFKGTAKDMFLLEKTIQSKNKENKYLPIKKFSGVKECFKNLYYE